MSDKWTPEKEMESSALMQDLNRRIKFWGWTTVFSAIMLVVLVVIAS